MPRILDVSQPVGTGTAVWPGDQNVVLGWTMRIAGGDSVNVAALTMSAHTGTHADGPFHFAEDGSRPAELDLGAYIGPALVIDAAGQSELGPDLVRDVDLRAAERVLFRTRGSVDAAEFPREFAAFTPELATKIAENGVKLVGTDAPSVDPFHSKTLDAHHIFARGRVAILENLVLTHVAPGRYTLVALPLKLVEADSSPVRAVLLEGGALS